MQPAKPLPRLTPSQRIRWTYHYLRIGIYACIPIALYFGSKLSDPSTNAPPTFTGKFKDDDSKFTLEFTDDSHAAYALLRENGVPSCGVWLYNDGDAPAVPEWNDSTIKQPANARGFASKRNVLPADKSIDFGVNWLRDGSKFEGCEVTLRGEAIALLKPGARLGWAKLAAKDSPLARVWKTAG